jgi:glucose/mannose-6-phosphate isomerase
LDTKALIIAVSYSGNTEETLSAFDEALKRHCRVVVITSGGELLKQAKMLNVPYVQLPQGFQPRQMLGYMFTVIISLLQNSGIIRDKTDEIMKLADALDEVEYEEKAKMFAEVLQDKVPIIYTTTKYKSAARFWKICFNENTKIQSFYNIIPEVNHNEMVGFTNLLMKPHFIFLESMYNVDRNVKRIKIMKEIFNEHDMPTSEFMMHGRDTLTQLFTTVLFGYWVSYFLAIMYETDPTPVEWVEDFKKRMVANEQDEEN